MSSTEISIEFSVQPDSFDEVARDLKRYPTISADQLLSWHLWGDLRIRARSRDLFSPPLWPQYSSELEACAYAPLFDLFYSMSSVVELLENNDISETSYYFPEHDYIIHFRRSSNVLFISTAFQIGEKEVGNLVECIFADFVEELACAASRFRRLLDRSGLELNKVRGMMDVMLAIETLEKRCRRRGGDEA